MLDASGRFAFSSVSPFRAFRPGRPKRTGVIHDVTPPLIQLAALSPPLAGRPTLFICYLAKRGPLGP